MTADQFNTNTSIGLFLATAPDRNGEWKNHVKRQSLDNLADPVNNELMNTVLE